MKYFISILLLLLSISNSSFASDSPISDYYIKFSSQSDLQIAKIVSMLSKEKGLHLEHIVPSLPKSNNLLSTNEINSLQRIFKLKDASAEDIIYISSNYKFDYIEKVPEMRMFERPNDFHIPEQYYLDSMDLYAVWDLVDTTQNVVIGIVDSGVDLDHEDLASQIWHNPGETGIDKNGKPKESNGIDDDNNGYIDDWQGWDFYGRTGVGDNNPTPGMNHGTHVAGIAAAHTNNLLGIAGIAPHAKILAVKASSDDPASRSITNGYQGILYAAMMGADIINCSFGGGGYSITEAEIIETAQKYGALIVAAAGNDYAYTDQYPASYPGVLSVASLTSDRNKSAFSNYGPDVDICGFGSGIFSTIPDNEYKTMSGTSMATPLVSGVAALVKSNYPDLTNEELAARLMATAKGYEHLLGYEGTLGFGEIDPERAITEESLHLLDIVSLDTRFISDPFDESINDTIYIDFKVKNIFEPLSNIKFYATIQLAEATSLQKMVEVDKLNSKATFQSSGQLGFVLPNDLSPDSKVIIHFYVEADGGYQDQKVLMTTANPSYLDMDNNNIVCTFNSEGNLGYNDYSKNQQGNGLKYKGYDYLFEGAIIAGVSKTNISNNARGSSGSAKNRNFSSLENFNKFYKTDDLLCGVTSYTDTTSALNTNISVLQEVFQSNSTLYKDIILVSYDITSLEKQDIKELFFGQFFDWDISLSGKNDVIEFVPKYNFAYAKDGKNENLPGVYIKILSPYNNNFYAINNNGNDSSISVYDGFTEEEKWETISSGLKRIYAANNDCSMVLSAGPIEIAPLDTVNLSFAIAFAYSNEEANSKFIKASSLLNYVKSINVNDEVLNNIYIYPNPTADYININLTLMKSAPVTISIYDISGKKITDIISEEMLSSGIHSFEYNAKELSQGTYFVDLTTKGKNISKSFIVIK